MGPLIARRAVLADVGSLRSVRLRAMGDAPEAFTSTMARELARTAEEWRRWIEPGPSFLLDDGSPAGGPVGVVAVQGDDEGLDRLWLVALWVAPEARGHGGGDALVAAVLEHARTVGAGAVHLHVGAANAPARALYARHGFVETGDGFESSGGACELELRIPLASRG